MWIWRLLMLILLVIILNLGFLIYYSQSQESFITAFNRLWNENWFKVTIFDLYLGLAFFSIWVFLRERFFIALCWTLGFILGGNLLTAIYMLLAVKDLHKYPSVKAWAFKD